jgi:hypothetical protein
VKNAGSGVEGEVYPLRASAAAMEAPECSRSYRLISRYGPREPTIVVVSTPVSG